MKVEDFSLLNSTFWYFFAPSYHKIINFVIVFNKKGMLEKLKTTE